MHWPGQNGLQGTFCFNDSLIFQFQGNSSPAARVREVFASSDQCRRKAVNRAFSLTDFNGKFYSLTLMIRKSRHCQNGRRWVDGPIHLTGLFALANNKRLSGLLNAGFCLPFRQSPEN